MQDLKYLTIVELESYATNLRAELKTMKAGRLPWKQRENIEESLKKAILDDEDLLSHVEAEILERTLLQRPNDDGASY